MGVILSGAVGLVALGVPAGPIGSPTGVGGPGRPGPSEAELAPDAGRRTVIDCEELRRRWAAAAEQVTDALAAAGLTGAGSAEPGSVDPVAPLAERLDPLIAEATAPFVGLEVDPDCR